MCYSVEFWLLTILERNPSILGLRQHIGRRPLVRSRKIARLRRNGSCRREQRKTGGEQHLDGYLVEM